MIFLKQVHLLVLQFCLHEHRRNPCPGPTEVSFTNSRSERCMSGTSGVVTYLIFVTSGAFRSNWRSRTPCFVPTVTLPYSTAVTTTIRFAGSARPLSDSGIFNNASASTFKIGRMLSPLRIIFCACTCKLCTVNFRRRNAGCDECRTLQIE